MPSSVGYGAAICRRNDETISVSPTPTNSSFGEGSADSKDFREYSGRSWSRSNSAMDRHSESSESLDNHSTSSGHERHLQDFGAEYIPTRTTKLTAPKPAYNPMQFVKTGPAKLCQSARLQMQKATEVKKVREVKKEESEDWQANLEGWKSSRRKRQEHVIERVTEVKRIEQEEALRAADAAAKRSKTFTEMMGHRGSRSRLLALYCTDESEESEIAGSPARDHEDFTENGTVPEQQENLNNAQAEECQVGGESDVSEYTYDKAIADYVKFTSTALSKSAVEREQPEDRKSESRTANGTDNNMETTNVSSVQRRSLKVQQTLASLQASQVTDKQSNNLSGAVEVVAEVSKRRSFFESAAAAAEDKEKEAAKSQHRRSGDFSSSFKNRLAAFTSSDSGEDSKRNSPARDPDFRQKLSSFQAVESKQETTVKFTDGSTRSVVYQSETSTTTVSQSEKACPDDDVPQQPESLKTAESTACQSETKASLPDQPAKISSNNSQSSATSPPQPKPMESEKLSLRQLEKITSALDQSEKDAVYKDQSRVQPKNSFKNQLEPPSVSAAASNSSAESDDCTEDEGIRSLSPRGTESPASPAESSQPITEIIKTFHFKETMSAPKKMAEPQQPATIQEVWDASAWLINDVSHVAPPVEKPPPPPPDDSEEVSTPCYFDDSATKDPVDSASIKKVRSELRKRRSDFLGIDVSPDMQNLLKDTAEVPPPPDLKSLLREAEFRTTDLRMYADETVVEDTYVEKYYAGETEEDELARVEREIIESLEKEELERQQQINEDIDDYITEGLNKLETSYDEDSAAIKNNIALLDTLAAPSYKPRLSSKLEEVHFTAHELPAAEFSKSARESATSGPVHSEKPKPPPVPAKPSRLSAAPKPRLHDGETWMAKRKAAVEGQRKEKDISRHWLIQEAEQRRITEQQERNHAPSHWGSMPSVAQPLAPSPSNQEWLSRSSSSTSMDKVSRPNPSPHLYSNQEEIFQYADFTHSPEVWQVRSVNTGSIDHLQKLVREEKQVLQHSKSVSQLASQKEPARRSTLPPETAKEPIAPLPDSVIHTLTQRVAQRSANYADYMNIQDALPPKAAPQVPPARNKHAPLAPSQSAPSLGGDAVQSGSYSVSGNANSLQEKMLSVSGKKKCSLCNEELGRGAAMIIESLRLFYHIGCFRCCVCGVPLGNGTSGTDVRVRNNHLHCHDCYSNDEGLKFSKV